MLGNFLTGEKATLDDRDLVLQRNGDNGMNRLCDQRGNSGRQELHGNWYLQSRQSRHFCIT